MKNLATYISGIQSLEILDISGNIITERKEKSFGVKYALEGIIKITGLRKLSIGGNRGINNDGTLQQLMKLISESHSLKQLNISQMGMDEKNCKEFSEYLIKEFEKDWNLNTSIRELTWDSDFKGGKQWLMETIPNVYNMRLTYIKMAGIFEEIDQMTIKAKLKSVGIECVLSD